MIISEDRKSTNSIIVLKQMNRAQYEEQLQEEEQFSRNKQIQNTQYQRSQINEDQKKDIDISYHDSTIRLSKLNEEEAAIIFENRKKELFENLMTQIKRSGSNSSSRKKILNYNSLCNSSIKKQERSNSAEKSKPNQNSSSNNNSKIMRQYSYNECSSQQKIIIKSKQNQIQQQTSRQNQKKTLERTNSATSSTSTDKKFIIYNDKTDNQTETSSKRKNAPLNSTSKEREKNQQNVKNKINSNDKLISKLKTNQVNINNMTPKESYVININNNSAKNQKEIKNNNYFSTSTTLCSNSGVQQIKNHPNEQEIKQRDGQSTERIGVVVSSHSLSSANHLTSRTPNKITSTQSKGLKNSDKEFGILLQNGNKQNVLEQTTQRQTPSQIKIQHQENKPTSFYLSANNSNSKVLQINIQNLVSSTSQRTSPTRSYLKSQAQGSHTKVKSELEQILCLSSNNSINSRKPPHRPTQSNSELLSANNSVKSDKQLNSFVNIPFKVSSTERPQQQQSYSQIYKNVTKTQSNYNERSDLSPVSIEIKNMPSNPYSGYQSKIVNNEQFLRKQESDISTQLFDSDQGGHAEVNESVQQQKLITKKANLSFIKQQSQALIKKQLEKQKNANNNINPYQSQNNELISNLGELQQQIEQIENNELIISQSKSSIHLDTSPFSKNSTQDQSIRDLNLMLQNYKCTNSYSQLHKAEKNYIANQKLAKSRSRDQLQPNNQSRNQQKTPSKASSSQSTPKSKHKKLQFGSNIFSTIPNTGDKTPLKSILVNGRNNSSSMERQNQGFSESTHNQPCPSGSMRFKDTGSVNNSQNNSHQRIQIDDESKRSSNKNDDSSQNLKRNNSAQLIDFRPKNQNYSSKVHLQQALAKKLSENEILFSDIKSKVTSTDLKNLQCILFHPNQANMSGSLSQKGQIKNINDQSDRNSRYSNHESVNNQQQNKQYMKQQNQQQIQQQNQQYYQIPNQQHNQQNCISSSNANGQKYLISNVSLGNYSNIIAQINEKEYNGIPKNSSFERSNRQKYA